MDAHLDTLSTELYQVKILVGCIARRQAIMGIFVFETYLPPTPKASEVKDEDGDDDATAPEDDDDGDANSSGTDETSTWHSYHLSLVTKKGSSFGYESSHT